MVEVVVTIYDGAPMYTKSQTNTHTHIHTGHAVISVARGRWSQFTAL